MVKFYVVESSIALKIIKCKISDILDVNIIFIANVNSAALLPHIKNNNDPKKYAADKKNVMTNTIINAFFMLFYF
jgi:hypothetical protein